MRGVITNHMVPILDVHILCLVHISMTFEPTGDTCTLLLVGFWDDQPCATRCEEDSKVYIERVPGSERGFQHLTEREDRSLLRSRCSFIFVNLAADFTLHFGSLSLLCFHVSLPALSSLLSSQLFFLFDIATLTTSAAIALGPINLCKCTQLFVTRLCDGCLCKSHTFNCIPKWDGSWGHTLPTKNTLCKTSSLALRCSAKH